MGAQLPEVAGATSRSTVAVVGLGGIGSVAAASLAAAGLHDVIACARRPLEQLTLERPEGTVEVRLRTLTDPAEAPPADWVLLCTKVHATASTAPWLARLCRAATRVAVLQNGIDQVASVAPLANGAEIVPAVVYYYGERLAEDRVRTRHVIEHDLAVPEGEAGRALRRLFEGTPLKVHLSPDFAALAWRKLLINAVANPLTALVLQRQAVLRRADMQVLSRAVLEEAVAAAHADGVALFPDEAARTLRTLETYPTEGGTSMYFDRLAGRPMEHEALTGAIVATAARHGLAVPLNEALLTLLRAINDAADRSNSSTPPAATTARLEAAADSPG
jgi:2-dehydropantoate 2-reductase